MKNFGGVRRIAAAGVAALITTSGLIAVGAATPAAAGEVYPCSETISVGSRLPERGGYSSPYTQVRNATLTIQLGNEFRQDDEDLLASTQGVSQPGSENRVATISAFAQNGTYVFTTTGGGYPERVEYPGTYGAGELIRALNTDGDSPPFELYTKRMGGPLQPFDNGSLILTYQACDSDGDGRPDSIDTCPSVANPDQRDLDGDGAGDACDADADGDGAVDTSDNCKMLKNDQTDADGDGIGNACDSTPYPPAPPASPVPSVPPGTPPGTTPGTTVPIVTAPVPSERTIALRYVKKKRVFKGSVGSAVGTCVSNAEVSLWRKKRGADRQLIAATTNDLGKFRTPRVRKAGKYYVTVRSIESICAAVRSRSVRVRRR